MIRNKLFKDATRMSTKNDFSEKCSDFSELYIPEQFHLTDRINT